MPTNRILKTIFITCFACAIILIILSQVLEPGKKLEGLVCALFTICCWTNFINGVFFKELYLKGVVYKGPTAIFAGYFIGLISVVLLLLTLDLLGILPRFYF